jgi:hypothetical protein
VLSFNVKVKLRFLILSSKRHVQDHPSRVYSLNGNLISIFSVFQSATQELLNLDVSNIISSFLNLYKHDNLYLVHQLQSALHYFSLFELLKHVIEFTYQYLSPVI